MGFGVGRRRNLPEEFEAWANGPVNKHLYNMHRGMFKVSSVDFRDGDTSKLSEDHKETIDIVLDFLWW